LPLFGLPAFTFHFPMHAIESPLVGGGSRYNASHSSDDSRNLLAYQRQDNTEYDEQRDHECETQQRDQLLPCARLHNASLQVLAMIHLLPGTIKQFACGARHPLLVGIGHFWRRQRALPPAHADRNLRQCRWWWFLPRR